jgi:hypothetical protein
VVIDDEDAGPVITVYRCMHFSRGTLRLQGVYGVDVLPNAMVVVRKNDLVDAVQGRYMGGG